MATVLDIWIPGIAIPQPRPKAQIMRGPRPFVKIYTPNDAKEWKERVENYVERAWSIFAPDLRTGHRGVGTRKEPLEGPLYVCLTFFFPRPQYMLDDVFKYGRGAIPCGKKTFGDIDNLFKSTTDAMTEAGIWKDDGQIAEETASKWYCEIGKGPGARIKVETFDDQEPVLFSQDELVSKRY